MGTNNALTRSDWSALLVDLYRTRFDQLARLAERIVHDRGLAEECVQDAFMKYHEKQARPAQGREFSYLRTMVRNGAISLIRREQRHREVALASTMSVEPSAELHAVASVMAGYITTQIEELAPRQSAVVAHRWFGLSVAETAAAMAISSGTVKTHRHRAAEAMRSSLGVCAAG